MLLRSCTIIDCTIFLRLDEKIIKRPDTVRYFVVYIEEIHSLGINIMGEEGKLVDFRNELISSTLAFKP